MSDSHQYTGIVPIMNVEIACDSAVLIMVMQTLIAAQTTSVASDVCLQTF